MVVRLSTPPQGFNNVSSLSYSWVWVLLCACMCVCVFVYSSVTFTARQLVIPLSCFLQQHFDKPKWQNLQKELSHEGSQQGVQLFGLCARATCVCAPASYCTSTREDVCVHNQVLVRPSSKNRAGALKVLWFCPWPESICHVSFSNCRHDGCKGPAHAPSGNMSISTSDPSNSCY